MDVYFRKIRFSLFTKSYARYFFTDQIIHSKIQDYLIEKLAKVLLLNKRSLRCFILHKTCGRKFTRTAKIVSQKDGRVSVYLHIEKELTTLMQERKDRNSFITEDYEHAMLDPAIERVAGNALSKVIADGEFEEKLITLKNIYSRWYYSVAYHYRLPTLRIIPFILRLIQL